MRERGGVLLPTVITARGRGARPDRRDGEGAASGRGNRDAPQGKRMAGGTTNRPGGVRSICPVVSSRRGAPLRRPS